MVFVLIGAGVFRMRMRALNDRGDESPEGELMDGILDQLAKFERATTAERSRRGKLRKVKEGKVIATHAPRYGFRLNAARDGYEVDEERMAVVRRIFRMVGEEGLALTAVARILNGEGLPGLAGGRWNTNAARGFVAAGLDRTDATACGGSTARAGRAARSPSRTPPAWADATA